MTTDDTPPTPADDAAAARAARSDPAAVPDEGALAAIATPASVRRAPRFGAFVRTGVLLGAVLGWLAAILAGGTTGEARTGAILISTVAVAGLGALLGAGAAALADRRSGRGVRPPTGPRGAR